MPCSTMFFRNKLRLVYVTAQVSNRRLGELRKSECLILKRNRCFGLQCNGNFLRTAKKIISIVFDSIICQWLYFHSAKTG